jgi:hypothetical protein
MKYFLGDAKLSENPSPTIWVVDNFYEDPLAIRNFALTLDYHLSDYHRGRRTEHQYEIPGTKERFEEIIGKKVTRWMETHGMCGRFQHCTCEDALVYHGDAQKWAGAIYLTPDAPYSCGTSLLSHKKTNIRHCYHPDIDSVWKDTAPTGNFCDGSKWEPIDIIANVFNRLVIWDAHCPHAASKYFGFDKFDSRLFHMFFFDAE